jgi:glycosyltransferase involved in cell wall biosynthesis
MRVLRVGNRALFNYQAALAARRLFRTERFDVVVDDMNKVPFFAPLFARAPVCGIGHHLFRKSIFVEINPAAASYIYAMESAALRHYARRQTPFIVNSRSTYDDFVAGGLAPAQLRIVHLAVNHRVYRVTGVPKSPAPLVAHFGRLKRYKSVEVLLRALPTVLREIPELKAMIVGEGDDRARLERIARELPLGGAVQFTGFVPEERQVEIMQSAWCAVATSAKEGWGMTSTEANACGTPVVASDVPGLRDSVRDGETGILYPYGDHEALARAMIGLLRDASLRAKLSAEALRWAGTFTWEQAAGKTETYLQAVAERRPLPD